MKKVECMRCTIGLGNEGPASLGGRRGIGKQEEFMWRGKERKMREAGIDGK